MKHSPLLLAILTSNRNASYMTPSSMLFILATVAVLFTPINLEASENNRNTVQSQELDILQVPLEELANLTIIGVSKRAEPISEAPMSLYIIEQEELKRFGTGQLYEIFQRIPGYSFYNTDFYGQNGVVSRGLQSIWRFGLSIELMPWRDWGHWTFAPNFFKNIEVARGPGGAVVWGSNAEAGLINLNIRDDLDGVETRVEIGNQGRQAVEIMIGKKFSDDRAREGDGIFIGFHAEQQDAEVLKNVVTNPELAANISSTDYNMNGINPSRYFLAKVQYDGLKLLVNYDNAHHVAPTLWFAGSDVYDELKAIEGDDWGDRLETIMYRVEYELPLEIESGTITLFNNYSQKKWTASNLAVDTQSSETFGFSSTWSLMNKRLNLNIGGDFWGQNKTNSPSITSAWAADLGIDWSEEQRGPISNDFSNMYMQAKYTFSDQWKALLGARVESLSDSEDKNRVSGNQAGVFYIPSDQLTFKYLFSNSSRAASANEILSSDPDPEELVAHEFIGSYVSGGLQFEGTLFKQELSDEIRRVGGGFNDFLNSGGINTYGVEWAIKYAMTKSILMYWNGSVQDATVEAKTFIDSDGSAIVSVGDHNDSGRPLFIPESTSYLGAEYRVNSRLKLNLAWRHIGNIPYRTEDNLAFDEKSADFFDFTASFNNFKYDQFFVNLSVLNLLDNTAELPAYGEHTPNNRRGLLPSEGIRLFVEAGFSF